MPMAQLHEQMHDVLDVLEIIVALQLAPQKSLRPDFPGRAAEDNLPSEEIREGEVRSGRVLRISPSGVLVDLGPADGLVHVSELSWDAGAVPDDLFKLGQRVQVFVLRVNEETGKIRLSIKRTDSGPWQDAARDLEVGQWLPAVVENAIPKGAFVQLFGPVDGYVKIAELVDWEAPDARELVQAGDVIPAQIIEIDRDRCEITLSMRRARPVAEADGWQFDDRGLVAHVPDHVERIIAKGGTIEPQIYDAGDGAQPVDADQEIAETHPVRTQPVADETNGLVRREPDKEDPFSGFERGTVHDARIVESLPTGLRVDIDRIRGFVGRKEIDGDTPPESFESGRQVRVCVVGINRAEHILDLSIRLARRVDAAASAERDGTVVPAIITGVDEDAAYALLPWGLGEARIALPDLADEEIDHASEVVSEEEVVPLKVLGFDDESRLVTATLVDAVEDAERNDWKLDEDGYVVAFPDEIDAVVEALRKKADHHHSRLTFSGRALIQGRRAKQGGRLIEELREGEIRNGRITNIRPFGVFVDLGGADGLAHRSELSWERDIDPAKMFKVGQTVKVRVLKLDQESKRINLSIRRAVQEQWSEVVANLSAGQIVPAAVTKLAPFGVFARIEGSLDGLIHISELADPQPDRPAEIVARGDVIPVSIVRIEHDRERISLSLKRARPEAEEMGWVFDSAGGIAEVPADVAEQFGLEFSDDEQPPENSE